MNGLIIASSMNRYKHIKQITSSRVTCSSNMELRNSITFLLYRPLDGGALGWLFWQL